MSGKTTKKGSNGVLLRGLGVLVLLIPFFRLYQLNQRFEYVLPNLLLFTGYRDFTKSLWGKFLQLDKTITYEPAHIPEIQAKDYSYEVLKRATENFRHPAIVRGLFKDAPGVTKWAQADYLPSKLGDFTIPVVRQAVYGTRQSDRVLMTFKDSFGEIISDNDSKMYLFFPVKSRFNLNGTEAGTNAILQDAVNDIVIEDLEVNKRIWNGFGTKQHSSYIGGQLIIGKGSASTKETTGTGWHCAPGNNYFVQVVGKKRWYFLDHEYSAYMSPLRGGMHNFQTSNPKMGDIQSHLPLRYVDIEAGDLLYNPDWQWHTIFNYEGLSIGVPIRELNASLSLRNNFHYSSVVVVNRLFDHFGFDIGGYPPDANTANRD